MSSPGDENDETDEMIFDLVFLAAGAGALLAAVLPRILTGRAFSLPLVFLGAGLLLFVLPLGLPRPDPVAYRGWVEHTTEVVVIVSLMGAGLAQPSCRLARLAQHLAVARHRDAAHRRRHCRRGVRRARPGRWPRPC